MHLFPDRVEMALNLDFLL